jgi:hypothetical protein
MKFSTIAECEDPARGGEVVEFANEHDALDAVKAAMLPGALRFIERLTSAFPGEWFADIVKPHVAAAADLLRGVTWWPRTKS